MLGTPGLLVAPEKEKRGNANRNNVGIIEITNVIAIVVIKKNQALVSGSWIGTEDITLLGFVITNQTVWKYLLNQFPLSVRIGNTFK